MCPAPPSTGPAAHRGRFALKKTRPTKRRSHVPKRAGKPTARRPAQKPIRILVADDQHIDRTGLVGLLRTQPDFRIVGEAMSSAEMVEACRARKPDVLIMSMHLPETGEISALSFVKSASPNTKIIAVGERSEMRCIVLNPPHLKNLPRVQHDPSCSLGTDCLQLAIAYGATGTLRRSAKPEELFAAIRAVASGHVWHDASTASALLQKDLGTGQPVALGRALSARETEVASLISSGRSNKEIADALGISEPTVKKHVGNILGKLGLQDRLQIGLHVARNPLLLRRGSTRRA
ncbi:MAG TPA: response regulator transcription factor [Candidatus Eisenbacteria bacterium]